MQYCTFQEWGQRGCEWREHALSSDTVWGQSGGQGVCPSQPLPAWLPSFLLHLQVSTITAEDFNVTPVLASRPWDFHPYVMDSQAACMVVYECPGFSMGIFLLKPNKCMPLHDHPGMHGIMWVSSHWRCGLLTAWNCESPPTGGVVC